MLEKLTQDESGQIFGQDGKLISSRYLIPKGKIRVLLVKNPGEIDAHIKELEVTFPESIPMGAISYLASDFNGFTQHIKRDDGEQHMFSAYAVQFYYNLLRNY